MRSEVRTCVHGLTDAIGASSGENRQFEPNPQTSWVLPESPRQVIQLALCHPWVPISSLFCLNLTPDLDLSSTSSSSPSLMMQEQAQLESHRKSNNAMPARRFQFSNIPAFSPQLNSIPLLNVCMSCREIFRVTWSRYWYSPSRPFNQGPKTWARGTSPLS
jgi:hypothetical protein